VPAQASTSAASAAHGSQRGQLRFGEASMGVLLVGE
jgi:hypothetical protein